MIFHSHANKTHFHKRDCALMASFWEWRFLELRSGLLAGSDVGVILVVMHAHNMRYKYWCIHTVLCSDIVLKVF